MSDRTNKLGGEHNNGKTNHHKDLTHSTGLADARLKTENAKYHEEHDEKQEIENHLKQI